MDRYQGEQYIQGWPTIACWSILLRRGAKRGTRQGLPFVPFYLYTIFIHSSQMYPYVTNPIKDTLGRTRNINDSLNIFADSQGPEGKYNPVFKVHRLGGVISQGLIGYITMVCVFFLIVTTLLTILWLL